jgi:hypothetical protein
MDIPINFREFWAPGFLGKFQTVITPTSVAQFIIDRYARVINVAGNANKNIENFVSEFIYQILQELREA